MVTQVSSGIKVSVETFYQPAQSDPAQNLFLFAYRITLKNTLPYPVQLKRRHWHIFDSVGVRKEVEGEGVVGEQPVIQPGQTYKYISGCNLTSEIGKMKGTYLFERWEDKSLFEVEIPEFMMEAPQKLN